MHRPQCVECNAVCSYWRNESIKACRIGYCRPITHAHTVLTMKVLRE